MKQFTSDMQAMKFAFLAYSEHIWKYIDTNNIFELTL